MKKLERNPVYDEAALKKMAARGISSLREKQLFKILFLIVNGNDDGNLGLRRVDHEVKRSRPSWST